MNYSPHLRTAVLLTGTGTAGAYHAGALRALQEAGIRIDLMSGRGMGVPGAMLASIDASAKTWEDRGIWRSAAPTSFYRTRRSLKWVAALLIAAAAVLLVPLAVLAVGLLAYPVGFLVQMLSPAAGERLVTAYVRAVEAAFAPAALPTIVPRLVMLVVTVVVLTLTVAAIRLAAGSSSGPQRRYQGPWWTRLPGTPWTVSPGIRFFQRSVWQLFRGGVSLKQPGPADLSKRYAELLQENLGQPGFRELLVIVHDLDARSDLVFALLAERYRHAFFHRPGLGPRQRECIDLAGAGRNQAFDALAGALSLPALTEPHVVTFAPETYWKGESHRLCDRPASVGRLLEELAAALVSQVIVVSASPERAEPHQLSLPRGDLRSRAGDHYSASEAAALHDSFTAYASRFQGVFVIQPSHNPVGPFDFRGVYDERSARDYSLAELVDRGYADAYGQFIDPVVGASGETLQKRATDTER